MNSSGTNYSWKLTFLTFLVAFGLVFGVATAGLAQTGPPGQEDTSLNADKKYTVVDGTFVAEATLTANGSPVEGEIVKFEFTHDGTTYTGQDETNSDGIATHGFNAPSSGGDKNFPLIGRHKYTDRRASWRTRNRGESPTRPKRAVIHTYTHSDQSRRWF